MTVPIKHMFGQRSYRRMHIKHLPATAAVPDSARVVQMVGQQEDPDNFLLMHAMAPNIAGVIGSAIAAGVMWSVLGKI